MTKSMYDGVKSAQFACFPAWEFNSVAEVVHSSYSHSTNQCKGLVACTVIALILCVLVVWCRDYFSEHSANCWCISRRKVWAKGSTRLLPILAKVFIWHYREWGFLCLAGFTCLFWSHHFLWWWLVAHLSMIQHSS